MREVLVINDDGLPWPGIRALITALSGVFRLTVVAPAVQQSWIGRASSYHRAMRDGRRSPGRGDRRHTLHRRGRGVRTGREGFGQLYLRRPVHPPPRPVPAAAFHPAGDRGLQRQLHGKGGRELSRRITRPARYAYGSFLEKRDGQLFHSGAPKDLSLAEPGTDMAAIREGRISISVLGPAPCGCLPPHFEKSLLETLQGRQ